MALTRPRRRHFVARKGTQTSTQRKLSGSKSTGSSFLTIHTLRHLVRRYSMNRETTLHLLISLDYTGAPEISRDSPGSDYVANFQEYQRRALPQKMVQRINGFLSRVNAIITETLTREIYDIVYEYNAEVVHEYQQSRRSTAETPANPQQGHSNDEAHNLENSSSQATEGNTQEDRLHAMYNFPPPPPGLTPSAPYRPPGDNGSTWNTALREALSSSQHSMAKRISDSSDSARLPTTSSLTNYSDVSTSEASRRVHQIPHDMTPLPFSSNLELLNETSPHPQGSFDLGYGNPNTYPQATSIQSHQHDDQSAGGSYVPSAHSRMLLSSAYDPSGSGLQSMPFLSSENPQIPGFDGVKPHGWTLAPGQFSLPQFPQIGAMDDTIFTRDQTFGPSWNSSIANCANMDNNGFDEGNLVDGGEQEPDPRPRKRRQRKHN